MVVVAGLERIYAHADIHDVLVAKALKRVKTMRQGFALCDGGCDVGSMATPVQLEHVQELVQDAIANGAQALAGGKIAQDQNGYFFEPTLLVNVRNDMRIVQEEVTSSTFRFVCCCYW